jgi:hypothetical protein
MKSYLLLKERKNEGDEKEVERERRGVRTFIKQDCGGML